MVQELIKKKLIIGGSILSVLCLLGLGLIFVPSWSGRKKDNDNGVSDQKIDNSIQNVTNFEFSFLKMENEKKNMLYSPLSIEFALNMLQDGALNNTYDEISGVIGNRKLPKYTSIDKVLSLANGLFINNKFYEYVKTEYINLLKEKYEAEVKQDEFKSAQNANKWIEDKTLGIIKDMLSEEIVKDPDLFMLIINALAIDMEWASPFSDNDTSGNTFYLDNGKEMEATMMFKKEVSNKNIAYYKNDDITVLSMDLQDYNGIQFDFMAIMPNKNLSGYVENVTKEQINEIDKNLKLSSDTPDGVNVKIPKFKFSYDLKLKEDLMNLGIKDAFDKDNANFSKMADLKKLKEIFKTNVYVSDALHKADIEFTEKGVKAAAVTVMPVMTATSMPKPKSPIIITIDKPFMFVIRDKATKDIWFTGTLYEPNSWENDKAKY